ncbi:MFS transporter [Lichenifustis flavocetrariae]|uniref:MFS transporter n=1 Tax=Lichenifustis flavocetrariae TaxID=2949735 RepID=A0AA41YV87_9HYPH|nr:MFS transporter [Lichenifustis flavocetrariae]MCW6507841.1 MFS transporter [Lichenifustis flavocetrariae]
MAGSSPLPGGGKVPAGWLAGLKAEGGRDGCRATAASALGVGVGLLGLPLLTIGLFMAPLHQEFGWSRAQIAGASTCINLATICAAPFVGRLCDRVGVRPVALASLAALTIGYLALAAMNGSLLAYYITWLLMAGGGVGTSGIVWTRAVGTFFERYRGRALGLALTGTAFAALLAPPLIGAIIASLGWRVGYAALGAVTLATIPITVLFFGERREVGVRLGRLNGHSGVELGEAVRSRAFWVIGMSVFFAVLGMGSYLVHFVPLAIDLGVSPGTARGLFAVIGLSMLFGRVAVGTLLDRLNPTRLSAVTLAVPALASLLLASHAVQPLGAMTVAAIILGLSAGAEVDILSFLVARYFGLRAYGAIYGCELMFFAAGSGIGGLLTGAVRDAVGSYEPALIGGVAVFTLAGLTILLLDVLAQPVRAAREA